MPTLTIDLELPEAEYQFASSLTQEERRRVVSMAAIAAFATARNVPSAAGEGNEPWETVPSTPEQIESLGVPLAQLEAGQVIDGDAFFERLYREKGWTLKP